MQTALKANACRILITSALLLQSPSVSHATESADLNTVIKKSVVLVQGPSGSGSGVVIGHTGSTYLLLTALHVLGSARTKGDESDVTLSSGNTTRLTLVKIFEGIDLAVAEFQSTEPLIPLPINEFLPYPGPDTAEQESPDLNLKSQFNTVTTKGRVAGYSLPTKTIKIPLFRVIDIQLVDKSTGNSDGYNLFYQASTVRGMSGGAVIGFRDCSNSGGFALGISPNSVFPVLLGIHGRSEEYGDSQGRSGISLGVPIEKDISHYLKSISIKYGIPVGEKQIRALADEKLCLNPSMPPEMREYMRQLKREKSHPEQDRGTKKQQNFGFGLSR